MENPRIYGEIAYGVAVIHGGPGAPGSIAPVARELSTILGTLEPFQTAMSLDGQVEELKEVLEKHSESPVILVGWSHGATLSCLFAASYPSLVRKLIIIGTPPFEQRFAVNIGKDRLLRFDEEERTEVLSLEEFIWDSVEEDKSTSMARLFRKFAKIESYDMLPYQDDVVEYQLAVNVSVGLDTRRKLANGELLPMISGIKCPVLAIHGDYDVRPAEGVRLPLSEVINDFRFILLEKCGHYPWYEKYARDEFYAILKEEIFNE
ncbi:MAG: alpha/beta hydrolase [Dehalococcoidales bacterium]|nr:MAG: alpha/beta hydrolase [Dehalococcoidales bacterium]